MVKQSEEQQQNNNTSDSSSSSSSSNSNNNDDSVHMPYQHVYDIIQQSNRASGANRSIPGCAGSNSTHDVIRRYLILLLGRSSTPFSLVNR